MRTTLRPPFIDLSRLLSRFTRSCARAEYLLSLSADGLATQDEERETAQHLEQCASCRAAKATMTAIRDGLQARPSVQMPPGLAERLTAAIDAERQREDARANLRHRRLVTTPRLALGGALAAACAVGLVFVVHSNHNSVPIGNNASAPKVIVATKPTIAAPLSIPSTVHHQTALHTEQLASVPSVSDIHLPPSRTVTVRTVRHHTTVSVVHSARSANAMLAYVPRSIPTSIHSGPRLSTGNNSMVAVAVPQVQPNIVIPDTATAPIPPAQTAPVAVATLPATTTADYQPRTPLLGTLRAIARQTQQNEAAVATVDLAGISKHQNYSSTVSMVSSSFR